jgi:hypothetical protein
MRCEGMRCTCDALRMHTRTHPKPRLSPLSSSSSSSFAEKERDKLRKVGGIISNEKLMDEVFLLFFTENNMSCIYQCKIQSPNFLCLNFVLNSV